ncbi:MAG TPA: SIMPL domain-containing protein [Capsulimonadaceae bacterium]|jgi:hypothetical protein
MNKTLASVALLFAFTQLSVSAAPLRAPISRPSAESSVLSAITVTGHSELKVKPDIAYANLQVITQDKDQSVAVAANATRTQAVIDTVKRSQIADKDIQTEYYTVQPMYDYRNSPAVLTGYQVTNSIRVTIRNLSKAGLIIDKTTQAGANSVGGVSFDLADRNKAQGLAIVEAVRNAASKADLIAGAAGVSVGRALSITEGTAPTIQPVMYAQKTMMMADASAPTTPIMSQDITITADVTVSYAIDYPSR